MNSKTRNMSSLGLQLNYKFTLCSAEALAEHNYCTNKLFEKTAINTRPEKIQEIHKYINEKYQICTIDHGKKKHAAEHGNFDLASQILQQNTILNSNTVYKGIVDNPLHININLKLNANASAVKIGLIFLEASQTSDDNYVNVLENSPEGLEIRQKKVTGSRLPNLLGFYGKTKFAMTWKNG